MNVYTIANEEDHKKSVDGSKPFEPFDLQRPPSIHSIRTRKLEQWLSLPSPDPEKTIAEEETGSFDPISNQNNYATGGSGSSKDNFNIISKDLEKSVEDMSSDTFVPNNESDLMNEDETDASQETLDDISEEGGCVECVKAIPVIRAEEIQKGDHIVFAGALYDHHGIVGKCEENRRNFWIVEATNTVSRAAAGIVFGGKAKILYTKKVFNFKTDNIRIVEYRNPRFSKQEIVCRAMKFITTKSKGRKFKYHLFANNCEHFATYCVTGKRFSVQVRKIRMVARMFFSSGFQGISNEKLRNEKEFEHHIICQQCFEINKKLLSASVTPIMHNDQVNVGDIIRYSYWKLWHDAVVLNIFKRKRKYIKCEVGHYCFHGPFSHREIIKEELKVSLKSDVSIVHYDPPQYDVYDPDTVVERARERIGEKLFVHFSNDSSHFARWCKLKLTKSSEIETQNFYCDPDKSENNA